MIQCKKCLSEVIWDGIQNICPTCNETDAKPENHYEWFDKKGKNHVSLTEILLALRASSPAECEGVAYGWTSHLDIYYKFPESFGYAEDEKWIGFGVDQETDIGYTYNGVHNDFVGDIPNLETAGEIAQEFWAQLKNRINELETHNAR